MQGTKSIRKAAGDVWNRFRRLVHKEPAIGRVPGRRSSQLRLEALEERSLLSVYAPAAGQPGSTAIHMDDTAFVGWATGWEDYDVGSNVDAGWQTPEKALGKAVGSSYDIVSLGRGGEITLTFDTPIADGPGWDFATFENSFNDTFLELGYVEVSSNGTDFFRFPNDSLTAAPVSGFGAVDPTNITGYCSKYKQGYGTPFDLAQLDGVDPLLDVGNIGYVKIVDIVGDGSALDTSGDVIYDLYPTVGSAGVDLDAIGVINTSALTFEDVGANLADEDYWNGPDPEGIAEPFMYGGNVVIGAFESGGLRFNNNYAEDFGSWTGWAYSNTTDTETSGHTNQFSAYTGSGGGDSRTYAVAYRDVSGTYAPPTIERTAGTEDAQFRSISVTNTTYAALSMLNGDSFATKFGDYDANGDGDCNDPGDVGDGSYPDWLLLTITGKNSTGSSIGEIEFYLADYRFTDDSQDYIVDQWTTIDLTPLEDAETLEFVVTSSDVGDYGMNTPAYFAADNITHYDPSAYFEDADVGGALAAESYWNGSDGSGGFDSGIVSFNNSFTDWGGGWTSWEGWSYSNMTDATTAGYGNQYSAYTGGGANGSPTYGVASQGGNLPTVSLSSDALAFESIEITNTTYAALSMLNGDSFAKKFGGTSGNDEDWFLLTIEGMSPADESVGTVEFYLADYRFADNSQDYILDEWVSVDLTSLSGATSLEFSLSSSDVGDYGMNTPAYFAADNITLYDPNAYFEDACFEDADIGGALAGESYWNGSDGSGGFDSGIVGFNNNYNAAWDSWDGWAYSNMTDTETAGFGNQYSAFPGEGGNGSPTYGVAYYSAWASSSPAVTLPDDQLAFESMQVTNTTYAYLSMLDGDAVGKKFGGTTGDDEDWFLLTIDGKNPAGDSVGTIEFYLADYRFADNSQDYMVDTWTTVDLTSLAGATSLEFSLSSSDVGAYGMNTPAYFAADNITLYQPQVVSLDASVGSDVIAFETTSTEHVVTINGTAHVYAKGPWTEFHINGLDGADQITIIGTEGEESASLDPGSVTVTGPGYSITATSVETVTVDGGTGIGDTVALHGSTNANRLYSYADWSTLSDSPRTFSHRVDGFEIVSVEAPANGRDYAYMYDSPANDILDASPQSVQMRRQDGTATRTVQGFQRVYAYAANGGDDSATLRGEENARNRYYGYADYSILTESRRAFYFYARGFDEVTAISPGTGYSYAYLHDSAGADAVDATPAFAAMNRAEPWSDTRAEGFKRVYAYSTRGGEDTALLQGNTSGGNYFRAYPTYSTLTDRASSFYHYARGFRHVTAEGSTTDLSGDRAYLYDSRGDDEFQGSGQEAQLKDKAGTDYENIARYFDLVYARSSDRDTDDTITLDPENEIVYRLVRSGTW